MAWVECMWETYKALPNLSSRASKRPKSNSRTLNPLLLFSYCTSPRMRAIFSCSSRVENDVGAECSYVACLRCKQWWFCITQCWKLPLSLPGIACFHQYQEADRWIVLSRLSISRWKVWELRKETMVCTRAERLILSTTVCVNHQRVTSSGKDASRVLSNLLVVSCWFLYDSLLPSSS